jgi:hypothetical protein
VSDAQYPTIEMAKGAEAPSARILIYSTPFTLAPTHMPHNPTVIVPDDNRPADVSMVHHMTGRHDDWCWSTVGLHDDRRRSTVASEATGHRGGGA